MIKIRLSDSQREELNRFRRQASSKDSEKALMVLMSADGLSVPQIAVTLKRNPHTVRDWLKRYKRKGLKGLSRNFSPGRPSTKRQQVKTHIQTILPKSPEDYGYKDAVWSVPLIAYNIKERLKISTSNDTIIRALKDLGYTYKRPSKQPAASDEMTREEKANAVKKIVDDIKKLESKKDCVIYALDESHFSTEPYLVRGWFFKRWPPSDINAKKKRKSHIFWMLESGDTKVLLEKIKAF